MKMPPSEPQAPSAESLPSRRDFAIMSVAAGIAATAGAAYAATPMVERAVAIQTPDGVCDAILVHPQARVPKPAVIFFPDAFGLRPLKVEMAKRLAANGYVVLVVNSFYRVRKAPVFPPNFSFANPDDRAEIMAMIAALDHAVIMRDAKAFVAFLSAQPEVDSKAKMGAAGFCMGGSMAIRAAAAAPDRVGAAVSFHGGRLVTDQPTSPHRLIAGTTAAYHIGIATDDDEMEPQTKGAIRQALEAAGRPFTLEVYPGAKHGWTVSDNAAYNPVQAERAWSAMVALYKEALV
jgi:carboxymethylenebutenolidase